jgi:hypothetical protein
LNFGSSWVLHRAFVYKYYVDQALYVLEFKYESDVVSDFKVLKTPVGEKVYKNSQCTEINSIYSRGFQPVYQNHFWNFKTLYLYHDSPLDKLSQGLGMWLIHL